MPVIIRTPRMILYPLGPTSKGRLFLGRKSGGAEKSSDATSLPRASRKVIPLILLWSNYRCLKIGSGCGISSVTHCKYTSPRCPQDTRNRNLFFEFFRIARLRNEYAWARSKRHRCRGVLNCRLNINGETGDLDDSIGHALCQETRTKTYLVAFRSPHKGHDERVSGGKYEFSCFVVMTGAHDRDVLRRGQKPPTFFVSAISSRFVFMASYTCKTFYMAVT